MAITMAFHYYIYRKSNWKEKLDIDDVKVVSRVIALKCSEWQVDDDESSKFYYMSATDYKKLARANKKKDFDGTDVITHNTIDYKDFALKSGGGDPKYLIIMDTEYKPISGRHIAYDLKSYSGKYINCNTNNR